MNEERMKDYIKVSIVFSLKKLIGGTVYALKIHLGYIKLIYTSIYNWMYKIDRSINKWMKYKNFVK